MHQHQHNTTVTKEDWNNHLWQSLCISSSLSLCLSAAAGKLIGPWFHRYGSLCFTQACLNKQLPPAGRTSSEQLWQELLYVSTISRQCLPTTIGYLRKPTKEQELNTVPRLVHWHCVGMAEHSAYWNDIWSLQIHSKSQIIALWAREFAESIKSVWLCLSYLPINVFSHFHTLFLMSIDASTSTSSQNSLPFQQWHSLSATTQQPWQLLQYCDATLP